MKRIRLSSIPPGFDAAFLDWFRDRTEAVWASLPVRAPEDIVALFLKAFDNEDDAPTYEEAERLGRQPGTRWLGGLSSDEIAKAEGRWGRRFPPDYRLFLRRLQGLDRPRWSTGFAAKSKDGNSRAYLARASYDADNDMVLHEADPYYYDWSTDTDAMQETFEELVSEIHNAPKAVPADVLTLIPVDANPHYLLADPCVAGNPVLWIGQGEIGVCAANLRDYLLRHFWGVLDLTFEHRSDEVERSVDRRVAESYEQYRAIPFWGDLL